MLPTTLPLEPLVFQPVFKDYLWGGERLSTQLAKPTGPGTWAESWEIVDWNQDQSRVTVGSLSGLTLRELLSTYQSQLVGDEIWTQITDPKIPPQLRGRFPLLIKFLDAKQQLSVQVHPNDHQAAELDPPDLGKTEAWYVVDAEPNSIIFAGLKLGVTAESFRDAITKETVENCLHSFVPKPGDCVFIPAGTQHALGAGLLILEVQQTSNTTYRVYDWNRRDARGNLRPLHIDQAIEVTNFSTGPVNPIAATISNDGGWPRVICEKFAIRDWKGPIQRSFGMEDRFQILVVTSGAATVGNVKMSLGQTVLLPPNPIGYPVATSDDSLLLEIWIPQKSSVPPRIS
jgi:mannose-6-phosphate isomerase